MSSTQSVTQSLIPSRKVPIAIPLHKFTEARRIQQSFLATAEKKSLLWLAARTPSWINSDHLTLIGLLAMAGQSPIQWA